MKPPQHDEHRQAHAASAALRAPNNAASGYWRPVDPGGAAPGTRFFKMERRNRNRRRGGQHHRNVERDGGDAEQAAAGPVVLALAIGTLAVRTLAIRTLAIRLLRLALAGVDCPVVMLVHCASMRMRLGFGCCGMDVRRNGRVFQAMRVAAERHRRVRSENAKRVERGEHERRRGSMPSDRLENPQHSRIVAVPWPLRIEANPYRCCRVLPIGGASDRSHNRAFMPPMMSAKARLDTIFVQMRRRLDAEKQRQ
jgi:hypothetical protein